MYTVAMGIITAIEPQKKRKGRINLYIDGRFFIGLDELTVLRGGLKIGDETDEQELTRLVTESETAGAFDKAVKLVTVRPRTQKEIAVYLKQKGYPDAVCDAVNEKLKEYRYLNDEAYAELYIRSNSRRYGDRMMMAELKRRGVDEETVRNLLDEREDEDREEDAAAVLDKYLRTHTSADKRKAYAHLQRRGFTYDVIRGAMDAAFDGRDEDIDDDYHEN